MFPTDNYLLLFSKGINMNVLLLNIVGFMHAKNMILYEVLSYFMI